MSHKQQQEDIRRPPPLSIHVEEEGTLYDEEAGNDSVPAIPVHLSPTPSAPAAPTIPPQPSPSCGHQPCYRGAAFTRYTFLACALMTTGLIATMMGIDLGTKVHYDESIHTDACGFGQLNYTAPVPYCQCNGMYALATYESQGPPKCSYRLKSWVRALLLQIFGGMLGCGTFYIERWELAAPQAVLAILIFLWLAAFCPCGQLFCNNNKLLDIQVDSFSCVVIMVALICSGTLWFVTLTLVWKRQLQDGYGYELV